MASVTIKLWNYEGDPADYQIYLKEDEYNKKPGISAEFNGLNLNQNYNAMGVRGWMPARGQSFKLDREWMSVDVNMERT